MSPLQDAVALSEYDLWFYMYLTQLIKVLLSLGTLEALPVTKSNDVQSHYFKDD